MKVCQNCGHENSDTGKFCGECGAKLVEAPKFCPECGARLEGTPKFCPECGTAVETGSRASATTKPKPSNETGDYGDSAIIQKVRTKLGGIRGAFVKSGSAMSMSCKVCGRQLENRKNYCPECAEPVLMYAVESLIKKCEKLERSKRREKINATIYLGMSALMVAAFNNSANAVKLLVKEGGANVETKSRDDKTALMVAARKNAADAAKALIESGANVHAKNRDGKTALMVAKEYNAEDVAKVLKASGARL